MLEELKQRVCDQNKSLLSHNLVLLTWGNASAIDRESGLVVIKPSGISYESMRPDDMVVVDLNGEVAEGNLRPSSDIMTHIELYKAFADIGGIVHTHSTFATAWAQAGRGIPIYGTTHADVFRENVPCTRALKKKEVENGYEVNTGKVIAEAFRKKNPLEIPAVLVKNHGVFAWGATPEEAISSAVTLEQIAKTAYLTETLLKGGEPVPDYLIKKHFTRKHGNDATYGQD